MNVTTEVKAALAEGGHPVMASKVQSASYNPEAQALLVMWQDPWRVPAVWAENHGECPAQRWISTGALNKVLELLGARYAGKA